MKLRHAFVALVLAITTPFTANADELDEARVRELVLETIRANPQIVMEAVAILEQQQAGAQRVQCRGRRDQSHRFRQRSRL